MTNFILSAPVTATEGTEYEFTITPTAALADATMIRWQIVPKGALPVTSSDFPSLTGMLSFTSGATTAQTVTFTPTDDARREISKDFELRIYDTADDSTPLDTQVVTLRDNDDATGTYGNELLTGNGDANIIGFGTAHGVTANGSAGSDFYVISRFQYGNVEITDTVGTNLVKFDAGVTITDYDEESADGFVKVISRVDLTLSTGAVITIINPVGKFVFQLGSDPIITTYDEFKGEIRAEGSNETSTLRNNEAFQVLTATTDPDISGNSLPAQFSPSFGSASVDVFSSASTFGFSQNGSAGDDFYVISRFQYGNVEITDTVGTNLIKFDVGVTITDYDEESADGFVKVISRVDLTLSTGAVITIINPVGKFVFQLGDDDVIATYAEFKGEIRAEGSNETSTLRNNEAFSIPFPSAEVANTAPIIDTSGGTAFNSAENQLTVTTLMAMDTTPNGLAWSLDETTGDHRFFTIAEDTGVLTWDNAPDFESSAFESSNANNKEFTVTVIARDDDGAEDSVTLTITLDDANDAPVFTNTEFVANAPEGGTVNNEPNRRSGATEIYRATATDADDGDTVRFSVFSVDGVEAQTILGIGSGGALYFREEQDYDEVAGTGARYEVVIRATDTNGATTDQTIIVNVIQAAADAVFDELPTDLTFAEQQDGSATPILIGSPVTATDANGDTVTYSLQGNPSDFAIDTSTGQISYTGTGLTHASTPTTSLIVVARSIGANGSPTDITQSVTIQITQMIEDNTAPIIDISSFATLTNIAPSATITDTIDDSDGSADRYTIGDKAQNIANLIDGDTELAADDWRDGDGYRPHKDGIDTLYVTFKFDEDYAQGEVLIHNREHANSIEVIQRIDDAVVQFRLDDTIVHTSALLDSANEEEGDILRVTAAADLVFDEVRIVFDNAERRQNLEEVEIFAVPETLAVDSAEGQTSVTTLVAMDENIGDTLSWSLENENTGDARFFSIDSMTGVITWREAPDFESTVSSSASNNKEFTITAIARDTAGETDSVTLTITLTDVNEAPIFASDNLVVGAPEGGAVSDSPDMRNGATEVYRAAATDVDDGDMIAYSVFSVDGMEAQTILGISPDEGVLYFRQEQDYDEMAGTGARYEVVIRATDRDGAIADQTIIVNVVQAAADAVFDELPTDLTLVEQQDGSSTAILIGSPVTATDADGDTVTYSLQGSPSDFAIDASTGQISYTGTGASRADNNPMFDVIATSLGANGAATAVTQSVTIQITQAAADAVFDDLPSDLSLVEQQDGSATAIAIGSPVTATDADGDTVTYSLGGDSTGFVISSSTGQISYTGTGESRADNNPTFDVIATSLGANGLPTAVTQSVTIQIAPLGENPPPAINLPSDSSTPVNIASSAAITTSITSYAGATQSQNFDNLRDGVTHVTTWSGPGIMGFRPTDAHNKHLTFKFDSDYTQGSVMIHSPAGANSRLIDGSTLQFRLDGVDVGDPLALDSRNQDTSNYILTVTLPDDDGGNPRAFDEVQIIFSGNSQGIEELEIFGVLGGLAVNSAENQRTVTTLTATDDRPHTLEWDLEETGDYSFFNIDNDGVITWIDEPDFEETRSTTSNNNIFTITAIARDDGGTTDSVTLTITLTNENDAPIIDSSLGTTFESAENQQAVVHTLTATDIEGDDLTWSLTDNNDAASADVDLFEISDEGVITWREAPDYETLESAARDKDFRLTVTVTADDEALGSDSVDIIVRLTDVAENTAPVITGEAVRAIESAENDREVATLEATDTTPNGLIWSLDAGGDAALFTIHRDSGAITWVDAPNYEETRSASNDRDFTFTARATDNDGATSTVAITVRLTNVSEAPVIDQGDALLEINSSGGQVTTLTASDDVGDTVTWVLSGADMGRFTIDSDGTIRWNEAPEVGTTLSVANSNVFSLTATVRDGGGLQDTINLAITLAGNTAPGITQATTTIASFTGHTNLYANGRDASDGFFHFSGTIAYDSLVGSPTSAAIVSEGAYAYLPDGTVVNIPAGAFELSGTAAEVNVIWLAQADDGTWQLNAAETQPTEGTFYALGVHDDDGEEFLYPYEDIFGRLTVQGQQVTDAPFAIEVPLTTRESFAVTSSENQQAVTTLEATDADGNNLTWRLSGADEDLFEISDSGVITWKAAPDFEMLNSMGGNKEFSLTATVTDGGLTDSVEITVILTDVFENTAPIIDTSGGTAFDSAENQLAVTTLSAADDTPNGLAWSLDETTGDHSFFTIAEDTGVLTWNDAPDFESTVSSSSSNNKEFTVTAIATDGGGLTDSITLTVTLTDDSVTPYFAESSVRIEVEEGGAVNDAAARRGFAAEIYRASATNENPSGSISYSILSVDGDEAQTILGISPNGGALYFRQEQDYNERFSIGARYEVVIRATDSNNGATADQTVIVDIVNDPDDDPLPNTAPRITQANGFNINSPENQLSVMTFTAMDTTPNILRWSLSDRAATDLELFTINPTTGELAWRETPDYETLNSRAGTKVFSLTVTVSDGSGGTDDIVLTVTLTDGFDNTAPVITQGTATISFTGHKDLYANGRDATDGFFHYTGTIVYDDDNSSPTFAHVIASEGAQAYLPDGIVVDIPTAPLRAAFEFGVIWLAQADDGTWQLNGAETLPTEGTFYVLGIADGDGTEFRYPHEPHQFNSNPLTVQGQQVTDAPLDIIELLSTHDSFALTTAENSQEVTTLTATDVDTSDTLTWSLIGGADMGLFAIDSTTGEITWRDAPDYETLNSAADTKEFSVIAAVTDDSLGQEMQDTIALTVTLADVFEPTAPVITGGTVPMDGFTGHRNIFANSIDATDGLFHYSGTITEGTVEGLSGFHVIVEEDLRAYLPDGTIVDILAGNIPVPRSQNNGVPIWLEQASDGTWQLNGGDSLPESPFYYLGFANRDNGGFVYPYQVISIPSYTPITSGEFVTDGLISVGMPRTTTVVDAFTGQTNVPVNGANDGGDVFHYSGTRTINRDDNTITIDNAIAYLPDGTTVNIPSEAHTIIRGVGDISTVWLEQASDGTWQLNSGANTPTGLFYVIGNYGFGDSRFIPLGDAVADTRLVVMSEVFAVDSAENQLVATLLTVTDETPNGLNWRLSGPDEALFQISDDGAVTWREAPNYETLNSVDGDKVFRLTATVTDDDGLADTLGIIVTLTDVSEGTVPIIDGADSRTVTSYENQDEVITLTASDADAGDRLTWDLEETGDYRFFTIHSTTGEIRWTNTPDYEDDVNFVSAAGTKVFTITARVTDGIGGTDSVVITVALGDIPSNTAPVIDQGATFAIESPGSQHVVTTLSAMDDTPNGIMTWSLTGGADVGSFTIDSTTGAITWVNAPSFDTTRSASGNREFLLTVTVTDLLAGRDTIDLTITLVEENEAPIIDQGATLAINSAENQYVVATLADRLTATDSDTATGDLRWSLTGADADWFNIDPETGEIWWASTLFVSLITETTRRSPPPNFETVKSADGDNVFHITMTVTDDGVTPLTDDIDIEVTLTNLYDESPVIYLSDGPAIANIAPSATLTTTVAASDYFFAGYRTALTNLVDGVTDVDIQAYMNGEGYGVGNADGDTLTFTFDDDYIGASIRIHNRVAERADGSDAHVPTRIDGSTVELLLDGVAVSPPMVLQSANQDADSIITVTPAADLVFDAVRITFSGNTQNINEIEIGGRPIIIAEDSQSALTAGNQQPVIELAAADADGASDSLRWSLIGPDASLFNISNSGVVTWKDAPVLGTTMSREVNNVFSMRAIVSDRGTLSDIIELTVTLAANTAPNIVAVIEEFTGHRDIFANSIDATDGLFHYSGTITESRIEGLPGFYLTVSEGARAYLPDGTIVDIPTEPLRTPYSQNHWVSIWLEQASDGTWQLNGGETLPASDPFYYLGYVDIEDGGFFYPYQTAFFVDANPPTSGKSAVSRRLDIDSGAFAVNSAENSQEVVTLGATDATPNGLTWTLGGADRDLFQVVDGVVTWREAPDYETRNSADSDKDFQITVTVTDDSNAADTIALTITLTNEDEWASDGATGTATGTAVGATNPVSASSSLGSAFDTNEYTLLRAENSADANTLDASALDAKQLIKGGAGADTIIGSAHGDVIAGGYGDDSITLGRFGSTDNVVYRWESGATSTATDGGDTIANFRRGEDQLFLIDEDAASSVTSFAEFMTYAKGANGIADGGGDDLVTFAFSDYGFINTDIFLPNIEITFHTPGTTDGTTASDNADANRLMITFTDVIRYTEIREIFGIQPTDVVDIILNPAQGDDRLALDDGKLVLQSNYEVVADLLGDTDDFDSLLFGDATTNLGFDII